jgi:hypothetical protein
LTRSRWRPYALAAAGAVLLAGLVTSGAFQADMVGSGNTNPPSIALLAYAAAQAGLVLAAERPVSRLLARPRPWRLVRRLNAMVMTVYLWHFVPVIIIAVAFYPTGVMPQPAVGSAEWWELRPACLPSRDLLLPPPGTYGSARRLPPGSSCLLMNGGEPMITREDVDKLLGIGGARPSLLSVYLRVPRDPAQLARRRSPSACPPAGAQVTALDETPASIAARVRFPLAQA